MNEDYEREPGLGILRGPYYTPEQGIRAMMLHMETLAMLALNSVRLARTPEFAIAQCTRASGLISALWSLHSIRLNIRKDTA
jgi:hypothetical protein